MMKSCATVDPVIMVVIKNVVRWNEGPVFNNVAPVLVEFKEEKDRWSIVVINIIVDSDSL